MYWFKNISSNINILFFRAKRVEQKFWNKRLFDAIIRYLLSLLYILDSEQSEGPSGFTMTFILFFYFSVSNFSTRSLDPIGTCEPIFQYIANLIKIRFCLNLLLLVLGNPKTIIISYLTMMGYVLPSLTNHLIYILIFCSLFYIPTRIIMYIFRF